MRRTGRKTAVLLTVLLCGAFLWGCGEQTVKDDAEVSMEGMESASACAIEVMKDGSIKETITEEFDQEYYDEESLKNMILSEVADFNRNHTEDMISVDKLENKNGMVTVKMSYPSAEIYTEYNTDEYNDGTLFVGTIAQAYEAGYSLDISMTDAKGEKSIGREELLEMGEDNILISQAPLKVKVPGKIMYVGDKVEADDRDEAYMKTNENGEAAGKYYIVYK